MGRSSFLRRIYDGNAERHMIAAERSETRPQPASGQRQRDQRLWAPKLPSAIRVRSVRRARAKDPGTSDS